MIKPTSAGVVSTREIEGLTAFIIPGPVGGLNGYVLFPQRPVKTVGYSGILNYVPVHGGITYAEEENGVGHVYGFDTVHYNSEQYPRDDEDWIYSQCEVMIKGIRMAADLEDEYMLAGDDNEKKAPLCQKILDICQEQGRNFGVMINLLGGNL